ncbi:MAG TPA: hypothetical protein VHM30_17535 [Gemmatimonadaceae bacterium]|nr:hypothetical protein [Gemmatimonadaceae bacterium]
MIFFRGKQPEGSVWKRFRTSLDGFTFVEEDDYYAAHVVANAERVVDLFYTLSEQLSPAVDLVIDDKRNGKVWKGDALALPDVRDAIARLKVLLAQHGGVEVSIFTTEDQLTLNPYLELFIYARTDRWLYMLEGKGLQEQRAVRTKSWKIKREDFPPAPELDRGIASAAERLGLTAT